MTAIDDAIAQNTPGNNKVNPAGVPTSYDWYNGKNGEIGEQAAPAGYTALTGWGIIYPQAGAAAPTSGDAVQVQNFTTWAHLTAGGWVELQNPSTDPLAGGHYLADFAGNSFTPLSIQQSGGVATMDAPTTGVNDHIFPANLGTFSPGQVDGVFVEAGMKTNDPNAHIIAALGADYWLGDGSNNTGIGTSNFTELTTSYQELYYTNLTADQLKADPPPGLSSSSAPGTPTTTPTTGPMTSPSTSGSTTSPTTDSITSPTTPSSNPATTPPTTTGSAHADTPIAFSAAATSSTPSNQSTPTPTGDPSSDPTQTPNSSTHAHTHHHHFGDLSQITSRLTCLLHQCEAWALDDQPSATSDQHTQPATWPTHALDMLTAANQHHCGI